MAESSTALPPGEPLQVDFTSLAIRDPDFGHVYQRKGCIVDFHDSEMMQCLTKSTLKIHFGLKVDLPADRLCPPVLYEYIRWIQSLLDTTSPNYIDGYDPDREVIGLDIGTGASCIYPLLGCSTRPNWHFGATEIDAHSLASARANIALNNLYHRIRVSDASSSTTNSDSPPLLSLSALSIAHADFVMCNPPFYSSSAEMASSAAAKSLPPNAICTGAEVEMVTEGGDYGFAVRIFEESLILREKVGWYSLMLGKLVSAQRLVDKIKEGGVSNWAVKCLVVGKATRRWCVGWSFGGYRPANEVERGISAGTHNDILPFPTELTMRDITVSTDKAFLVALRNLLTPLAANLLVRPMERCIITLTNGDVWSRSARRKQKRNGSATEATISDPDGDLPTHTFAAKITKQTPHSTPGTDAEKQEDIVVVRWLRGESAVVFESFCGIVRRALGIE